MKCLLFIKQIVEIKLENTDEFVFLYDLPKNNNICHHNTQDTMNVVV